MSYLTTPQETLEAEVIAALESEGFAYDPLRHTWPQYLATVLGDPTAYLFKSIAQMLSEVDAQYGGSLSHLRASIARLLDDVAANIGAGGGGGGGNELLDEDGLNLLDEDGETLLDEAA